MTTVSKQGKCLPKLELGPTNWQCFIFAFFVISSTITCVNNNYYTV